MSISKNIENSIKKSSWIRKMFETGVRLKKEFGEDKINDFSLGNPDLISPQEFNSVLNEEAQTSGSFVHGYMPNGGYLSTRQAVAEYLNQETGQNYSAQNIIMSVGAAGGLNVILKSLLNPDDEVIVIAPYFVEYDFYITNHGGKKIIADSTCDLLPDLKEIEAKITTKTKALIINTPNNPTGKIYSKETLQELSDLLTRKSKDIGSTIYLLSDEPYKKIIYDNNQYHSPVKFYDNTIIISSFSKDLSLAGERIGYIGINPQIKDAESIINAATFCTRILGFVNAPALMQRVVARVLSANVDISKYQQRRDLLYNSLIDIGYKINKPEGAFYLFPESPIEDDVAFVRILQEKFILTTPGSGFHRKGHFRISYCVENKVIERSIDGFRKAFQEVQNK